MASTFRKRCKYIFIFILTIYLLFSLYASYELFDRRSSEFLPRLKANKDIFKEKRWTAVNFQPIIRDVDLKIKHEELRSKDSLENPVVEIWGKAAIGLYLWEHILGGRLESHGTNLIHHGRLKLKGIQFRFRTGPGIVQGYVPTDVQYLILVLNGRDHKKIAFAKAWLDYLAYLPHLRNVALVLLGDEKCNNDWVAPYMEFRGGKIKFAFLTYDSPLVDNVHFYQWPLGVATYRNFPNFGPDDIQAHLPRAHLCNFLGTVYPGSSRQALVNFLKKNASFNCIIRSRQMWLPSETKESLNMYVTTLKDSALTLSPIGINSESYRIYEALSCGSIPVVENVISEGNCGGTPQQMPYRLLKTFQAPLLYVTNWEAELPALFREHTKLPFQDKVHLHQQTLNWYHNFKMLMKHHFVDIVKLKLLNMTT